MTTRKSTPKHEIVTNMGVVIMTDISKTEANSIAREMNKETPKSQQVSVRSVK